MKTNKCPRCAIGDFTRTKRVDGIRHTVKGKAPGIPTLERYSNDGIAKATDGCRVEPDGVCQHGHQSWLMALGYI